MVNKIIDSRSNGKVEKLTMDGRVKRTICACRFPKLIIDTSYGDGDNAVIFYSIPIEVIEDIGLEIPLMEEVEEKSPSRVSGKYMKVTWAKPHSGTKMYEIVDHLVVSGCPEDALQCDASAIYVVYHPIEEWNKKHIIEYR